MGKKRVMLPVEKVDFSTVKYEPEVIQAPHLTGLGLKLLVKAVEAPLIGPLIISHLKNQNGIAEMLQNTDVPEPPMFRPEYPPQAPEPDVVTVNETGLPQDRVKSALKCLLPYDPSRICSQEPASSLFKYWKIRDYAHAYRSKLVTPFVVAEHIISVIEEFNKEIPSAPLLISFNTDEVRKQAAASTLRFQEGNPISILDGIFVAIKDDIDCYPHPSKGGSTWMHEVRSVNEDAVSVSRLRRCGVILVGKANQHELGMGTTGNNPNYGSTRNPHAVNRYTGGSSSGSAAIVASGLCSAALGTDAGGSVRIPSSLCGVVGLKTTYGRTNLRGTLLDSGTVTIIGPIASSVEDVILIYAAILGSSPEDRISLNPSPPCLPNLSSYESTATLGSLRMGKYTEWFNDVHSTDISDNCEHVLNLLSKTHGCEMVEIVIPEMQEMRTAHLVSVGSEMLCSLYPDLVEGKGGRLTLDSRVNIALFQSFSASDYVAAQQLRRRLMYYHMEIFKKVDVIVTPTTGMTAPVIPSGSLEYGETNMQVTASLMQFVTSANLLGLPAISVPVHAPVTIRLVSLSLDHYIGIWYQFFGAISHSFEKDPCQLSNVVPILVSYDKQGLPIGLQIIGRPWGEATILRLAAAVEELCGMPNKQPESYFDVLKPK